MVASFCSTQNMRTEVLIPVKAVTFRTERKRSQFCSYNKANAAGCRRSSVPMRGGRVLEGVPPAVQLTATSQGTQRAAAQVLQLHSQSVIELQQCAAQRRHRRQPSKGCQYVHWLCAILLITHTHTRARARAFNGPFSGTT